MARISSEAGTKGSALRRLLLAQESGLILVILLMMAALTAFGGKVPGPVANFDLPAGATVVPDADPLTVITDSAAFAEQLRARFRADTDGSLIVKQGDRVYQLDAGTNPKFDDGPPPRLILRPRINKFLNPQNLVLVVRNASYIAVMAVGMTAIIILGGIDLSVGSVYALAAVVGALSLRALTTSSAGPLGGAEHVALPVSVGVGVLVCCGVGAVAGAANGAMIVGLRVHPFIITLGTMAVFRGLVFILTQGQSISDFPASFTRGFFKAQIGSVYPVPIFVMAAVVAAGQIVLTKTVLGRRSYAIGGNETAAFYAGVPVGRVKFILYTLSGLLAGLSACVYLGYLGAAEPGAGNGYELNVIAATVIGGASLQGGRGSALGAMLGAVLVELINSAMVVLDIPQSYTQIVMGSAIILAVVVDQTKTKLMARGW